MNKALDDYTDQSRGYGLDWRKSMSDNVAWALIVYTGLQILFTMGAMKETGMKSMALLALVVLVAAIIPACRKFEKRWASLSDEQAADPDMSSAYRRDQMLLWILALGLPALVTGLLKLLASFT